MYYSSYCQAQPGSLPKSQKLYLCWPEHFSETDMSQIVILLVGHEVGTCNVAHMPVDLIILSNYTDSKTFDFFLAPKAFQLSALLSPLFRRLSKLLVSSFVKDQSFCPHSAMAEKLQRRRSRESCAGHIKGGRCGGSSVDGKDQRQCEM